MAGIIKSDSVRKVHPENWNEPVPYQLVIIFTHLRQVEIYPASPSVYFYFVLLYVFNVSDSHGIAISSGISPDEASKRPLSPT